MAGGLPVVRQLGAVVVDDLHLDAIDRPALLLLQGQALLGRETGVPRQEVADAAQRRHFGHPPGVDDEGTELRREALAHCPRRRRTADDDTPQAEFLCRLQAGRLDVLLQHQPHRWHAERQRDPLVAQQFVDAAPVECRSRHHQPRAAHRARVGHSPGVDVEHRHDQQDTLVRTDRQPVDRAGSPGMQHRRAVRVEHAFRIAGRPRGVTERGGTVLVELRPREIAGLSGEQLFVTQEIGQAACGHVGAIGEDDVAADPGRPRREPLDQRQEAGIEEQQPIFGVVDDVLDLLREEARIDRVQNRPHSGHAVVQLHMPITVPGQRRDPLTGADAKRRQRVRQLAGTAPEVGIGTTMDRPLARARDDLRLRMQAGSVLDQRRDQQRLLLHQSLEHQSSSSDGLVGSACSVRMSSLP